MQRIVLIDGENLVYGLRILLRTEAGYADRARVESCNFRGMLEDLLSDQIPAEILWFGAHMQVYEDPEILKLKSEEAVRSQTRLVSRLEDQRITFIEAGYLRARQTDPCERCGHRMWHLAEKGVDVGLAVRMVTEARSDIELVVITADTDLLPAFLAAKDKGARVMHVGHEHHANTALSDVSDSTRMITAPLIEKYLA